MAIKTVLNPSYDFLKDFVDTLPQQFSREGRYVHKGRNEIKVFETKGLLLNVKRYRIPLWINRVAYTFFRAPKAERAYQYALRLRQKKIDTPEPVAYLIEKKGGLLSFSYFVSIQVPYTRRFYEFGNAPLAGNEEIIRAFARYTAKLHEAGIYHRDYSPGNILFDLVEGKPEFCIVDINRMEFGEVSLKKGCANFARLWGQKHFFLLLACEYAKARHFDENECCRMVLEYRRRHWVQHIKKRPAEFQLDL